MKAKKTNGEFMWCNESYREFCVTYILSNGINIAGKYNYQFGIYSGTTLRWIYQMYRHYNLIPEKILAFDSFEGVPEERKDILRNPDWIKGFCNMKECFDTNSTNIIIEKILASLPDRDIPIDWHVGFFDQVLTSDFIKRDPKPAFWVDLDVDLYISTIQVLDFMFKNHLIVKHTLVSFDDWGGTEEYKGGESLAWKEMCEKYSVTAKEIHCYRYGDDKSNYHCQKVFRVDKVKSLIN